MIGALPHHCLREERTKRRSVVPRVNPIVHFFAIDELAPVKTDR